MGRTRERTQQGQGFSTFTYVPAPGEPSVTMLRFGATSTGPLPGPHVHDYLALAYFDADGGSLRTSSQTWSLRAGDAFISAPGDVADPRGLRDAHGWAIFFTTDALGSPASAPFLSWRSHPLLFPFIGGGSPGVRRIVVHGPDRAIWSSGFEGMARELDARREGYREAVTARLTLLLVEVARLMSDVVNELRLIDEPLLADVFGTIERRYREHISLRDIAGDVSVSPGHLTTVVRRKTGRTVQGWITERRMVEARRELAGTDRSVEEVARDVGFQDPAYFIRSFRRVHGATPLAWRKAARA